MPPDPLELERQLQQHGGALRRLAGELVRDAAAADDAVQETWLHAARRPPRDGAQFGGWLVTVLRRAVRRSQRGDRRRQQRERTVAREAVTPDHAEVAARTEVTQRLLAAVNALDAPYREAIWQRYFESLPPRVIAQRSGVPVATVKSRLQRALQQLRTQLGDGGESDWRSALALAFGFAEKGAAAAAVAWHGGMLMAAWTKVAAVAALVGIAAWMWWPTTTHTVPVAANDAVASAQVAAASAPPLANNRVELEPAAIPASVTLASAPATAAATPGIGGVRGRAVDETTRLPLAGVVVTLTAGKLDQAAPDPVVTTAADGTFAFDVRAGARWGLRGRRADRTSIGSVGDGFAGHVEELGDLAMRPGRALRGRVVDEGGEPIPPKTLVIVEGRSSGYTEPDGTFEVDPAVPLGPTHWSIPYGPFELIGTGDLTIAEREPETVQLAVRRRASIRGIVVDEHGQPVAGVRLSDQPGLATIQAAADGTFTVLRMRPQGGATTTIFVGDAPGCAPHAPIENVPWGTENLRIELQRVPPFAIEVVDDRGAPVESFGISLDRMRDVFARAKVWQRGTHAGGTLLVDDVVRGATRLRVLPTDPALTPSDFVAAGDTEPLRFVLQRRRELRLCVRRGDDVVPGVAVHLVRERGTPPASLPPLEQIPDPATAEKLFSWTDSVEGIASGVTDADGRVVLRCDRDANGCALYLRPEGSSTQAVRPVVLPADGGELAVQLPGAGGIRGRVQMGTFTYQQVRIEIPQAGRFGGRAIELPPDGTFAVDLQAGEYRVDLKVVLASPCTVDSRTVVVTDGAPFAVDFDLGGLLMGRAHGTVTAAAALLPPTLVLAFVREGEDGSAQSIASTTVAADGTFAVGSLLPGTYHLAFSHGGPAQALPALQRATFAVVGGADVAVAARYEPRRLTVHMVRPDGSAVRSQRVLLRCAGATWPSFSMFAPLVDETIVLDPVSELPVEFRDWTPGSPWSEPVVMPDGRAEAEVTVVLPAAPAGR